MFKQKIFIQRQLKNTSIRGFQKTRSLLSYLKNTWILSTNDIRQLAKNPNTSPEILNRLANEEDFWVRYWVAYNHNTPIETLVRLANDEFSWVCSCVAANPNSPQYLKDYLKIRQFLNCHNNNSIQPKYRL